jgi:hypothetical protein
MKRFLNRFPRSPRGSPAPPRRRPVRPRLEGLEERWVPTLLYALGHSPGESLVQFDSAAPATLLSSHPIQPPPIGPLSLSVEDIDVRPANGLLYGTIETSSLHGGFNVIDSLATISQSGQVSQIRSAFSSRPTASLPPPFTLDFDPVTGVARVVNTAGQNLRVDPLTGTLLATDANLAYAAGDPNAGQTPSIGNIAFGNDVAGASTATLYGIDTKLNVLVTVGPANAGTLHTVGPLGVSAQGLAGFDIVTAGGADTAYAAITLSGGPQSLLFTINLNTGAATLVGPIGGTPVTGLAAVLPAGAVPHATPGTFDPASGTWYLRNQNSGGAPDAGQFPYGGAGWLPVVGDWDGNGSATVGVVDPGSAIWYLRNENSGGAPDVAAPFLYGLPGWVPVVGDWSGTGHAGIGMFDPATATWYLRNEDGPGAGVFQFGGAGWLPVVGDWTGSGITTVGVVDPRTMTWYLRNANSGGGPDITPFPYGGTGWKPVVGDWTGGGATTAGVVDPNGVWYLRNRNSGGAPDVAPFPYGLGSWTPVAGSWSGVGGSPRRAGVRDVAPPSLPFGTAAPLASLVDSPPSESGGPAPAGGTGTTTPTIAQWSGAVAVRVLVDRVGALGSVERLFDGTEVRIVSFFVPRDQHIVDQSRYRICAMPPDFHILIGVGVPVRTDQAGIGYVREVWVVPVIKSRA